VGLFSFFRNRRAAESALGSPEQQAAIQQALAQANAHPGISTGPSMQVTQTESVGGLAALGVLFSQLQAAKDAGVTVETTNQVIDLRGADLRGDILEVIAAHGLDANRPGQAIDASSAAGLQADILAVLSQAGIDVTGAGMPTGMPASPEAAAEELDPSVPQIRNPLKP
jgi:hypothetical protein